MFVRLGGLGIIVFWAASMTWLVWHDVWPAVTAGQPPRVVRTEPGNQAPVSCQVGIFNKYGHRVGSAWSTYYPIAEAARREDTIHLQSFIGLPETLVQISSSFDPEGQLDEFKLEIWGHDVPVKVTGERFSSMYGFNLDVGTWHERLRLEADAAGLIGDVFRPFASLPGLKVGQSWRMQVVNPIALLSGFGDRFVPMLVRVTRREPVTTLDGRTVDCVVEAPNAKAWVDEAGTVIVQQVELPVGGTLTIRAEPYDRDAEQEAVETVKGEASP